ncbi:MAG: HNH endonuclease signature motif containing protein [Cytophagales bacterium]
MKLINFLEDHNLNSLRDKMGAELLQWNCSSNWNSFDPFGFRASLREKGEVDIPFSEINISKDGTLELFGQKILVYIRDQRYDHEYKFHIANCATLIDAQRNQKYDKYVASINVNGKFKVNIIHDNRLVEKDKEVKLNVCKNCLTALNYKGYRQSHDDIKQTIYNTFSIDEFFQLYKKQTVKKPKHTNITAPINNYTKDFDTIANELKSKKKYICESCSKDLSKDKKFLHVHHIDGIKSNNSINNLKVVCIGCHANEPGHRHMKLLPEFREYIKKYGKDHFDTRKSPAANRRSAQ